MSFFIIHLVFFSSLRHLFFIMMESMMTTRQSIIIPVEIVRRVTSVTYLHGIAISIMTGMISMIGSIHKFHFITILLTLPYIAFVGSLMFIKTPRLLFIAGLYNVILWCLYTITMFVILIQSVLIIPSMGQFISCMITMFFIGSSMMCCFHTNNLFRTILSQAPVYIHKECLFPKMIETAAVA